MSLPVPAMLNHLFTGTFSLASLHEVNRQCIISFRP